MYQRPKSSDCLVISVGRSGISVWLDIRNMFSPFYVVVIGKIRAKVAAAALFAAQCGAGDHQPDGDDAPHAAEFAVGHARCGRRPDDAMPRLETCECRLHAVPVAQQAAVPP